MNRGRPLSNERRLDSRSAFFQRMSYAAACPMGTYAADMLQRLQSGRKVLPFRFGFTARCVSLGHNAVIVHLVTERDEPRRIYIRGPVAQASVKFLPSDQACLMVDGKLVTVICVEAEGERIQDLYVTVATEHITAVLGEKALQGDLAGISSSFD